MADFPASHRDLLDDQVATLATIDDDGFPQLTEVWFLYDDGQLKVSINTSRHKARYLRERPECSLLLLDLKNPYRYLEVRGRARVERDADRAFATRVGAKYDADLAAYDAPEDERLVVRIGPGEIHPGAMSSPPTRSTQPSKMPLESATRASSISKWSTSASLSPARRSVSTAAAIFLPSASRALPSTETSTM